MVKRTVVLEGGGPWGFRMKGGKEYGIPPYVEAVTSLKAKNAGLQNNDIIHSINGQSVEDLPHNTARNIIVKATSTLTLSVESSPDGNPPSKPVTKAETKTSSIPEVSQKTKALSAVPATASSNVPSSEPARTENKDSTSSNVGQSGKVAHPASSDSQSSVKIVSEDHSEIKSPYMKLLAMEPERDHTLREGSGITNIKKAVTLDKPLADSKGNGGSKVTIGAPAGSGSKVKIGGTANPGNQKYSAIPPGSIGGRVTSPQARDFIKEKGAAYGVEAEHSKVNSSSGLFSCHRCKDKINDPTAVNANGGYYHTHHFTCIDCNASLTSTRIFEKDNKELVCQNCYENKHSNKCFVCQKGLSGQYLSASNRYYHVACFNCSGCKRNLQNCGFINSGDRVLCQDCHNEESGTRCSKCSHFIAPGESYVNIKGESIHSKCFVCDTCGEVLTSFKERDGSFFCPQH